MEISRKIGTIPVITFADYVLKNYGPMSHLKLQKLLFYCEAYHLAYFDKASLTSADFEAWVHGPVCREVFNELRDKSLIYSDLKFEGDYNPDEKLKESLMIDQIEFINDILSNLTKWKDSELEKSTHEEYPWIEARGGIDSGARCTNIISKDTMYNFYRKEMGLAN